MANRQEIIDWGRIGENSSVWAGTMARKCHTWRKVHGRQHYIRTGKKVARFTPMVLEWSANRKPTANSTLF
jgi:hypothetical protein